MQVQYGGSTPLPASARGVGKLVLEGACRGEDRQQRTAGWNPPALASERQLAIYCTLGFG